MMERLSKRSSPPQERSFQQNSSEEALEWDSAYQGMYGGFKE